MQHYNIYRTEEQEVHHADVKLFDSRFLSGSYLIIVLL